MRIRRNKVRRRLPAEKKPGPFFSKESAEEKPAFFAGDKAVQRKLNIGRSNDPMEKEAESTARKVVGQQVQKAGDKKEEDKAVQKAEDKKEEEKPVQKADDKKEEEKPVQKADDKKEEEKPVQKAEDKKEEEKPVQKAEDKKEEEKPVQAKEDKGSEEAGPDFEDLLKQRKGGGAALPDDLRLEMEQKFKSKFSLVRIHTDKEAAMMCRQIHALAFTHGYDIYFAEGQYHPHDDAGKELLAHELTHIVQQNG